MSNITPAMVKELREMSGAGMMDCKKALNEAAGDMEAAKELLRKKGQALADKKSSRETNEGGFAIAQAGNKAAVVKVACETDFVAKNDAFKEFTSGLAHKALAGAQGFEEASKQDFVNAIGKLGENMKLLAATQWEASAGAEIASYVHTNGKIAVLVELAGADSAKLAELGKDIAMHIAACKVEAVSSADLDPAVVEKEKAFLIEQAAESGKPANIIEKMVEGRLVKFKKEICLLEQGFVKEPDKTIAQLLKESGNVTVKRFFKDSF